MYSSQLHYIPLAFPFFLVLAGLLLFLVVLIQIRVLQYAYAKLGLSSSAALLLLLASLIGSYFKAAIATLVVTFACYLLAQPVPGIGIAIPSLVPPIIAAMAALLVARANVAAVAYIGGSLGTLIGADLLNLSKVQGLGAPVVSIGGAGTFDGIFITGIIAVLLASFSGRA